MELPRRYTAGGVVLGEGGTVALVHNDYTDSWTFPKGGIEEGESDEDAARREVLEETGLTDLELIDDLGSYERESNGKGEPEIKVVHLYLFAAPAGSTLTPSEGVREAKWVPIREVAATLTIPKDQAWYGTVFERVRQAVQRD